MFHQQDRHGGFIDPANGTEICLHGKRRQTKRRFIDDQQFQRSHQLAPNRKHRLLPTGHGTRKLPDALLPSHPPRPDLEPITGFSRTVIFGKTRRPEEMQAIARRL